MRDIIDARSHKIDREREAGVVWGGVAERREPRASEGVVVGSIPGGVMYL